MYEKSRVTVAAKGTPLLVAMAWLLFSVGAGAEDGPTLPEPLTLEQALSLADTGHPDLVEAQAQLDEARARLDGVAAGDRMQASLQGRLQWVDPSPVSRDQSPDDHRVGVLLSKRLHDFGRTEAKMSAAEAEVESERLRYADRQARRRIQIMQAYFDVLLADLQYARDNEDMATAYVNFDKLRDRNELGQVSDIELLEAETEYQRVRSRRYASDVRRRATRSRLALALNQPGNLPSTLVEPDLSGVTTEIPEVEKLQAAALEDNPRLQALRKDLQAAGERVRAARAGKYPIITGEVEAAEYARELGSSDRLRAGITFKVPLHTGGAVEAAIAEAQARLTRVKAELARAEMDVRQRVLELWQRIYVLGAQRDEAQVTLDYRDLYLDRSRALYELDVNTDLGDSMVEFSAARLQAARARYDLALALAELDALVGRPVGLPSKAGTAKGGKQ